MCCNYKTLRAASAGLLLSLGACATAPETPVGDSGADPYTEKLSEVFNVGYSRILSRYIDSLQAGDLAVSGLYGLVTIDPTIEVDTGTPKKVRIRRVRGKEFVYDRPLDGDLAGWVAITVDAVKELHLDGEMHEVQRTERVFQATFDAAMESLDRYSRYYGADEARRRRAERGGFGGIGIKFRAEHEWIVVVSVQPESPAERVGLKAGDRILAVNGEEVTDWTRDRIVDTIRGQVGTSLELRVANDIGSQRIVEIRREQIVSPTVIYSRMGEVASIQLTGFRVDTANRLEDAVRRAKQEIGSGMRGIILDMRNNPGGLLDQSVRVSDLFLDHGRIVSAKGRHPSSLQSFEAHDGDIADGLPIVVVVDGRSASAAEIVASALQDAGRAVVIGATSYGKGTVQNVIDLPNDGEISLTWARFHAPSGYALQHLGVMPTVCTSAFDHDAPGLLRVASGRRQEIARRMVDWRLIDVADEEGRQGLREFCPSVRLDRNFEIDVAIRLLDDRVSYLRALDTSATTLAGQ